MTPQQILALADRMDEKAAKGFRVSPTTAAVVIEALRLYAREQGIQGHKMAYAIDRWDKDGDSIEERVAETSSLAVAKRRSRSRRPVTRTGWSRPGRVPAW